MSRKHHAPAGTGREKGSVILRAERIEKSYKVGLGTLDVLHGIDLTVRANEILAIAGPSGAGKSTLLHILGLLEVPCGGRVFVDDVDMFALGPRSRARYRCERIGFVFQFYHLLKDLDALENVCLPAMVQRSVFSYDRREATGRARALLERVGLGARLTHLPAQLSGGERQRVAIARALMNQPDLLLCDEPTGNLDSKTAEGILELIWDLKAETESTFVIVTHDEELAARADRVVYVVDGKVADAPRRRRA